uniref:condensation domain-containing protein n=1 Tax=Pseudomonas sp. dw_612 TaxID=2720080 RepID=UPI002116B936
ALNPARRLEHTPVFQVMFSWQNDDFAVNLAGLQATPIELECTSSKYDLELDLRESGGALVGSLVYPVALFDRLTVVRHLGYLEAMLRAMVADPGQ